MSEDNFKLLSIFLMGVSAFATLALLVIAIL